MVSTVGKIAERRKPRQGRKNWVLTGKFLSPLAGLGFFEFQNPRLKPCAIFFRRPAAENKIKWFEENGWTGRVCTRNPKFVIGNGQNYSIITSVYENENYRWNYGGLFSVGRLWQKKRFIR